MSIERRYPLLKHDHDASDITSGTFDASIIGSGVFAPARLGSGTANNTTFLRGDSVWTNSLNNTFVSTAQEGLRTTHDNAYVSFYNTAGNVRRAFIQASGSNMYYYTEASSPVTTHRFYLQDVEYLSIASDAVRVPNGYLYVRPNSGTTAIRLQARTDTSADATWIQWYRANGVTERGYLGYGSNGSDLLTLMSQVGGLQFLAQSGELSLSSNGSNLLRTFIAGNEVMRNDGSGLHSAYIIRATGWYGSQGTFNGPAVEIGYTGGSAFLIGYNRNLGAYTPLRIDAESLTVSMTGTNRVTFANPITIDTTGSGSASRNVEIRTSGQALIGFGGYAGNWRPSLTIGGETSANYLFLVPPSTAGDYANIRATNSIDIYTNTTRVASFESATGYFVTHSWTRWNTTNVGIYNVDGYYLYPSGAGGYRWFMRGSASNVVSLVLQDVGGNDKTWLYASGNDFGLLNAGGSWGWRYDSANAAWVAANGNQEVWAAGGFRWQSSHYLYNTSGYTYGTWRIGGTNGGYVGLVLDGTKQWTFMSDGTNMGLYSQVDGRWSLYVTGNENRLYSGSTYYASFNTDSTWVNMVTNTSRWYMDKQLHVNGPIYRYNQGAVTHYGSSSYASGVITVQSGGSPTGGSDGDQYLIY